MLAGQHRLFGDLVVRSVGSADVDCVNVGIDEQCLILVERLNAELFCELLRGSWTMADDADYVEEFRSAQGFEVDAPHEPGSDDCCLQPLHPISFPLCAVRIIPTTGPRAVL